MDYHNLTHWGWATHICVGKLTIIGSDNGLSPGRRQAVIWTNAGILLIGPLGTNFSEILIGIETFSFTKMHLKMSSAKWRPFVSASMCWCNKKSHDRNHKMFKSMARCKSDITLLVMHWSCISFSSRHQNVPVTFEINRYICSTAAKPAVKSIRDL